MVKHLKDIYLFHKHTDLGAQEASMVKKSGSMKSSKTSFLQALLV